MANPVISKVKDIAAYSSETATYTGVAFKSVGLVGIVTASALATWFMGYATPITTGVTAVMGFIIAMAICFRPTWAGFLAPLYAVLEVSVIGRRTAHCAKKDFCYECVTGESFPRIIIACFCSV